MYWATRPTAPGLLPTRVQLLCWNVISLCEHVWLNLSFLYTHTHTQASSLLGVSVCRDFIWMYACVLVCVCVCVVTLNRNLASSLLCSVLTVSVGWPLLLPLSTALCLSHRPLSLIVSMTTGCHKDVGLATHLRPGRRKCLGPAYVKFYKEFR